MASASCHYCNRPAEEECSTCGRLYCLEHGEDVCLRCLAPEAATPSGNVYRGSLLALVAASLVALFLWFSPPASKTEQDTARSVATATPSFLATATPTRPGATPSRTTVASSPTAAGSATAAPGGTAPASPTTAGAKTYTVQPGDTLSGIASANGITLAALQAANPGVTAATLQIGAVLTIPAP
ncbi:MAG: LysM peptidoglycan-binding domain-containing protein [Dehalococcoidia bacterium]|nr:LysM peptidoglycan-binding domain-containing protein [Dehalococcoidia bacterium]